MNVLGIDPGIESGIALLNRDGIIALKTLSPTELIIDFGGLVESVGIVIVEDSRLTQKLFSGNSKKGKRPLSEAEKLKIARDVGSIDGLCRIVEGLCVQHKVAHVAVAPGQKGYGALITPGKKLDAKDFRDLTRWEGKSNQHTRDAAVCAWGFRLCNPQHFINKQVDLVELTNTSRQKGK